MKPPSLPDLTPSARATALAGSGGAIIGLFAPLVSVPILGSFHLFAAPGSDACLAIYVVLLIAGVSIYTHQRAGLVLAGLILAALSIMLVVRFEQQQSNMMQNAGDVGGIAGGLTSAAAAAVQLEWGIAVLFVSAGCLIAAAFVGSTPAIVGHSIGASLRDLFSFRRTK